MPTQDEAAMTHEQAEHGSLARWMKFEYLVRAIASPAEAADILRHERVVMGSGDNAYVACGHPVHGGPGHWCERQAWPCPELLQFIEDNDIETGGDLTIQVLRDKLAYGPRMDPAERRKQYEESLPPGLQEAIKTARERS